MIPDWIERNLLILLNTAGETNEAGWLFVVWRKQREWPANLKSEIEKSVRTVYCFERRDIAGYFFFRWHAMIRGIKGERRNVLYINDGLLSSIFDLKNKAAYRTFSIDHLSRPKKLRQKLILLLPVWLRAEKRYVVIEKKTGTGDTTVGVAKGALKGMNFMFFSNAPGKLLITRAETIISGEGIVFKTTANSDYARVMEKEFSIMNGIAILQGTPPSLPLTGKRFRTVDRTFFMEEYVKGRTLREVIHGLSQKNDIEGICVFLDRLNEWFLKYCSLFQGEPVSLSSCYGHLFNAFNDLYGQDQKILEIEARAHKALTAATMDHRGVITIVAHNDLWPGNFIVNKERLIAIDWERAASGRAPFFDYYWMIISTVLEYHVSRIGVTDYSRAFRIFIEEDDPVSQYGLDKLKSFLERHSLDKMQHRNFLLLFLMEWSVQGYLALGSQTAMDNLAFRELVSLFEDAFPTMLR